MGIHKTVNGAYQYRCAPFLMPTYYVKGCSPLALPLGELSPQVTERAFSLFSLSVFASLNRLSQKETRGQFNRAPMPKSPAVFGRIHVHFSQLTTITGHAII